jgi:hypothetical protein
MALVIHKAFIKSSLKKVIVYSDDDWESDSEDVKPKKKRRLTNYNKFMRITIPVLRTQYPGEKQAVYMQMVGAMWRLLPVEKKKSLAR